MLETERIFLRRLTLEDTEAIYAMRSDAEMMRFIKNPENIKQTRNWIKLVIQFWDSEKRGFWAVVLKETNEVVGWCGIWRLQETNEIEIGYAISKRLWKQGLATEAGQLALRYGFECLNADRIVAVARPKNTGSRRVMEKLGLTFEKIDIFYGFECAYYAINREDYARNRTTDNS
jgi:ribosomal-protein-alanine N-acetyltransferase